MREAYRPEVWQQIQESLEVLKELVCTDLLGAYLYGSALVGGLQKYSDLDVLVITNRQLSLAEKAELVAKFLKISGLYMQGSKHPLEITLVHKEAINPWRYPPYFDFQYGEWLRDSFEQGNLEPWANYEMPDIAIIVTQVLLKSHTLWGPDPKELLPQVPYHDFIKAMTQDLARLSCDLEQDTRNVLLTYARIWSTLATDTIRSKPAAADWVMRKLPELYLPVMRRAKLIAIGVETEHWHDIQTLIKPCADFMSEQIQTAIACLTFDDPEKVIRLVTN
jgi:predicted nucleotidyltransferase